MLTRVVQGRGRVIGKRLAAILVCFALLGCAVVKGTITTISALSEAGFSAPEVNVTSGDVVSVRVRREAEDLTVEARKAGEIVWRNLPLRIEQMTVVCEDRYGARGTFTADRGHLIETFGARDESLDRGVQQGDVRNIILVVAGAALAGLLLLGGIVGGILLLVRRNKRQTAP